MIRDKLCQKCRKRFKFDSSRVVQGAQARFLGGAIVGIGSVCSQCAFGHKKESMQAVDFKDVEVHDWVLDDKVICMTATANGIVFAAYAHPGFEGGNVVRRFKSDVPFDPRTFADQAKAAGLEPIDPGMLGASPLEGRN